MRFTICTLLRSPQIDDGYTCSLVSDTANADIFAKLQFVSNLKIPAGAQGPPTSLKFLRDVQITGNPVAVCHFNDYTYVGLGNGAVSRIDSEGKVSASPVKFSTHMSMRACGNRLICLQKSTPTKIFIYGTDEQLISSWDIQELKGTSYGNKICVLDDAAIAIMDHSGKQISVYDMTGKLQKQLTCSEICSSGELSVSLHNGRLFISYLNEKKVLCLNVMTGNVESTLELGPSQVQGLACYEGQYLLVAEKGTKVKLVVIDIYTGESQTFPQYYCVIVDQLTYTYQDQIRKNKKFWFFGTYGCSRLQDILPVKSRLEKDACKNLYYEICR